MLLEVIAFTIESCKIIEQAGAHRIELCDNAAEGGTTPSYGMMKAARKEVNIPIFPIIRPRGGDFLYSGEEFEIMKNDIAVCKSLGCDGVVMGILLPNGDIDKERTSALVELAWPLSVTFHRAFDRTVHMQQALEDVVQCGCERILTSGLHPTAEEGIQNLHSLVQQANGRIIIMPGSGIRANNIQKIASGSGAEEFHSSARITARSLMQYQHAQMAAENSYTSADAGEIKNILQCIPLK